MTAPPTQPDASGRRRLRRRLEGRLLGGVAAGVAEYLDIDVAVVRVGMVALCLCGGMAVPLYLAGWLLIPDQGSDTTIAGDLRHRSPTASGGAWTS
jgi:phage shock protein C